VIGTGDYPYFLESLDRVFGAEGAEQMVTTGLGPALAAWTSGWDRLFFVNSPGAQSVYALILADGLSPQRLQARWDEIARGIASGGALSAGTLTLIVVAVYANGADASALRVTTRVTPSSYLPNLKPATWAVDLRNQQLEMPSRFRRPREASWIRAALATDDGSRMAPEAAAARSEARQAQMDMFYGLMRGRQPVLTYTLIAINVVVYGLESFYGGPDSEPTLRRFGALFYGLAEQGQWWRFLTMMFLHASPEHILFNMMSLFVVGTLAERLYGSAKFLAIYLGSGLIASLTSFAWAVTHGQTNGVAVGASGAIFGIAGALVSVRFQSSDVIPRQLRERVTSSMLPMVLLTLVFSQFLAANVDLRAHLGGLIGGIILSLVIGVTGARSDLAFVHWMRRNGG